MSSPKLSMQCGPCTACCYTHAVEEIGKPMFTRCEHLGFVKALGREGCTIYDQRPASCRKMACSWLQGKLGKGADTRPDKFGLVTSGHVDEGIGATAHIVEVTPGAVNRPDALKWFCEQTRAAERGEIQPIVLERLVGKLIYGTPELMARLQGGGDAEVHGSGGDSGSHRGMRGGEPATVGAGQSAQSASVSGNQANG